MANNSRYYYSLPTQAPQSRSGSRRPPLTPSTVSSPCLSTAAVATRRDSGAGSPTRASALLAKVVSHPPTPKGETPSSSPMCTPGPRPGDMQSSPVYSSQRPAVWRSESARCVQQQRHQGMHTEVVFRMWNMGTYTSQTATLAFRTLRSSVSRRTPTTTSIGSTLR
jgi:hypothetical protein